MKRGRRIGWGSRLALGGLASLLLAACGGGSSESPGPAREGAMSTAQAGELLAYVKAKLGQREELRKVAPGIAFVSMGEPPLMVDAEAGGAPALRSGTTVQEAGVDEDDLIKTDGATIYTLDPRGAKSGGDGTATLAAHRRLADGGIELAATLALPVQADTWPVVHGMMLAATARRIAVLGEAVTLHAGTNLCPATEGCLGGPAITLVRAIQSSQVQVQLVEAGADGALAIGTRYTLSGRLIGSRLIGNSLVVVSTHTPLLEAELLPPETPEAERRAAIDALQVADVLPTLRVGGAAARPLVADTDCYLQTGNASPGIEITTISVFDLASADAAPTSRCVAGGTEAIYLSQTSLVLATTRYDYRSEHSGDVMTVYPAEITTDLHKFALGAEGPAYRGSGTVAGHLGWDPARKSYRISEHRGDLRVLSFTGETGWAVAEDAAHTSPSPATLTMLRENAATQTLERVAQLPNERRPDPIGKPGEQVYAVRFLGERAYVVTFRQIDPLYVIDLADPLDPRVAGALEVPGFSDWLFPIGDGMLFGVGRQADTNGVQGGVKVALFDVRNPAEPALLAEHQFGMRGSSTALDSSPHGIDWLTLGSTARIALPMMLVDAADNWRQGLQRIEVDTAARTLVAKPLIASAAGTDGSGLWDERSVQIGAKLYYLSAGALSVSDW